MNLHNIRAPLGNFAIWVNVMGRGGRGIGGHLWQIEPGEPPELTPMPEWNTRRYWQPSRYAWRPFADAMATMFRTGWVRPLCGRVSRSTRPHAYQGYGIDCHDCYGIARERGIIPMTINDFMRENMQYTHLMEEMNEWHAAGRPDEWPPVTT